MVAKIAGLASGALVATLAVWAFNEWRNVSDQDRLEMVLLDNCIPFVETGQTPFEGMGRPVGVYDAAELSENITGGGSKILFDNRFVAQWGDSTDQNSAVRVCQVSTSYADAQSVGFDLDGQTAVDWINTTVAAQKGLALGLGEIGDGPTVLIWQDPDGDRYVGLRLVLIAQNAGVSSVSVVSDVDG